MADYNWFDEKKDAYLEDWNKDQQLRAQGFVRAYGLTTEGVTKYYLCRRGCGTVVWDIEAHMKNVCPLWNPVAG